MIRIGSIVLRVDDLQRQTEFWEAALGYVRRDSGESDDFVLTVLHDVCGQYSFCRFDDYAVFNYAFGASDVSKLDYFHPSLSGQAHLASVTWEHSWWATL